MNPLAVAPVSWPSLRPKPGLDRWRSQAVPRSSPVTCTAVGPGHEAELEPGAAGGAATGSGFHWGRSNSDASVTGPAGITVALGVLPAPVGPPWCHGLRGMGMVEGVSVRLETA